MPSFPPLQLQEVDGAPKGICLRLILPNGTCDKNGTTWTYTPAGGSGLGDIVGPAAATDNAVVRFDLTTGKLVQNSVVTIADTSGNMAGVGTLNTHTIPGGTDTFALLAATQTLTNKTLTSPTLTTPALGVATATSINKITITAPATGATLTIPDGVTLNAGAGGTLGSNAFNSTAFVPQTTTVNGKALSGNITLGLASADFANQGTTTTVLHGNAAGNPSFGAVSLTADVSGILPTANGGTGIAFFTAAGPTVARVYTFPDAAATVLTTNAAVTVAQGGTGLATLTANNVMLGNGTSTPLFVAPGTSGNVLTSNGTTWTSAAAAGGGIGGSTGATDNAILRADGVGGATAQSSLVTIDDTGFIVVPHTKGVIVPNGNNLYIGIGTGNGSGLTFFGSNGTLSSDLSLIFSADNTNDIGASGASRPRNIYLGGWMNWAGEAYLASNQTNATATLASTTLSVTLQSSKKYGFKIVLFVSDSVAGEGVKVDLAGGTATATTIRAHAIGTDTAVGTINTQVTALNTAISAATFTGAGMIVIEGAITVASGGTFIPQFAQNSHSTGTLTLAIGSSITMFDMP